MKKTHISRIVKFFKSFAENWPSTAVSVPFDVSNYFFSALMNLVNIFANFSSAASVENLPYTYCKKSTMKNYAVDTKILRYDINSCVYIIDSEISQTKCS